MITNEELQTREKNSSFGKNIVNKILVLAAQKELSNEDIDTLYQDATFTMIQRMFENGTLERARFHFNIIDISSLLTNQEKSDLLIEIDDYLNGE